MSLLEQGLDSHFVQTASQVTCQLHNEIPLRKGPKMTTVVIQRFQAIHWNVYQSGFCGLCNYSCLFSFVRFIILVSSGEGFLPAKITSFWTSQYTTATTFLNDQVFGATSHTSQEP